MVPKTLFLAVQLKIFCCSYVKYYALLIILSSLLSETVRA